MSIETALGQPSGGAREGTELQKLKATFGLPSGKQGDEKLIAFKAAFDSMDSDGSGTISAVDLPILIKKIGWSKPSLEADVRLWVRQRDPSGCRVDFMGFAEAFASLAFASPPGVEAAAEEKRSDDDMHK